MENLKNENQDVLKTELASTTMLKYLAVETLPEHVIPAKAGIHESTF